MLRTISRYFTSLSRRIFVQTLLYGLIVCIGAGFVIEHYIDDIFNDELLKRAATVSGVLETFIKTGTSVEELGSEIDSISEQPDVESVILIAEKDGLRKVVGATDHALVGLELDRLSDDDVRSKLSHALEENLQSQYIIYEKRHQTVIPITFSTTTFGGSARGALYLSLGVTGIYTAIDDQMFRFAALLGIAVFSVMGVFYFLIQRVIFKPLRALDDTIRKSAAGDTRARVTVLHDDEIGAVSASFNNMLEQLAVSEQEREAQAAQVIAYAQQLEGKTVETEMARSAAERATSLKSEFLANMSHEIRTPINGVLGMTSLLLETPLNAQQKKYAETTMQSAETLLALINDILDFSKIESGKLKLEPIAFDFRALISSIIDLLMPKAQAKNIDLLVFNMTEIPRYIVGDPVRIRQITTNLIDNAIKFTNQGYVKLILDVETPAAVGGVATLRLAVKDTGVGIAEKARDYIFDKFTQADASTTRQFGGTGLGLAISKQLVGMMDGQIGVESEPGQGSVFWFTMRVRVAGSAEEKAQAASDDPHSKTDTFQNKKILLVEDNEINRFFAVELLNQFKCRVVTAESGREAVSLMHGNTDIDLILMDCQMPEMDGFAATRAIRAMENDGVARHVPIIALTALAMKGDRERCLAAGMDDYLTKPLRKASLINAMSTWLGGNVTAQEIVANSNVSEHVLDEAVLREVKEFMGDKFSSVLQMYLRDAQNHLDIIFKGATDSESLSNVMRAAHSLKSASAHIGAGAVSKLASELEASARAAMDKGTMVETATVHAQLVVAFDDTKKALAPWLVQ